MSRPETVKRVLADAIDHALVALGWCHKELSRATRRSLPDFDWTALDRIVEELVRLEALVNKP